MGSEWTVCKVAEIAERTFSGPFGSNIKSSEYVGSGVPVVRGINLAGPRFKDGDYVFVTEEKASKLSSSVALPDDIVFAARGSIGAVGIVPNTYKRFILSSNLIGLRVNRRVADPQYIFYYFRSRYGQQEIQSYVSTTGVPKIARALESLRNFRVLLPPLPEQRAIAHILGTLDDKIELLRRMNETLEAMARALFKSWFVDFDPVIDNALEAGDPIPDELKEKAKRRLVLGDKRKPLPEHIRRLFPDRFVDSELGPIPAGWRVDIMGNHFRITMGQSPPGSTYNETGDGLPFYQGRVDFGFRFPSRRIYCTAPTRFAEKGDTLVTVRAPVGDTNMALERCCIGRGVAAIRHLTGSRSYTYYFVRYLRPTFESFEAEGTVFGAINKRDFNSIRCAVPPKEVIEHFEILCKPLDAQIERNECESRTLTALRDVLLPKLVSGEIRVSDTKEVLRSIE